MPESDPLESNADLRLYRLPDVIKVTGLSKTSIYRLEREGRFPARVRVTNSKTAWRSDEIQTWINDRPRVVQD